MFLRCSAQLSQMPKSLEDRPRGTNGDVVEVAQVVGEYPADPGRGQVETDKGPGAYPTLDLGTEHPQGAHMLKRMWVIDPWSSTTVKIRHHSPSAIWMLI